MLHTSLLALIVPAPQGVTQLRIDPLLIAEAAEVWAIVGAEDNPVWPGWNARETPLLFYLPGVQDVLVNHPSPPAGFAPYEGPLRFPVGEILVRDGETHFSLDGQNTATDIAGVRTLVVADTLSNQRPNLTTKFATFDRARDEISFDDLIVDPYGQLGMIAHEAFHVFQHAWGADKLASESLLLEYPVLSAENNVGVALEASCLERALRAEDEETLWLSALELLAVRLDRRAVLPASAASYEDGTEFNEGLAKYVEWRLSEVLEGREPSAAMAFVRDFRGYDDLGFLRDSLLRQMRGSLTGETIVNGDPYGTAPVRFRLYYSGMALAAVLDRIEPDWKARIAEPGTTLTGILNEVLAPSRDDLGRALERARDLEGDYEALVRAKRKLREDGAVEATRRVAAVLEGEGTLLTVDYAALGAPPTGWSYTPFGIFVVDQARTLYSMTPVGVQFPSGDKLQQTRATPLLHDSSERTVRFRLLGSIEPQALAAALGRDALPAEPVADVSLALDGFTLDLARARFVITDGELRIELLAR